MRTYGIGTDSFLIENVNEAEPCQIMVGGGSGTEFSL